MVEKFNTFFVATTIYDIIQSVYQALTMNMLLISTLYRCESCKLLLNELENIIITMANKYSTDDIHLWINDQLSGPLFNIVNGSLKNGVMLDISKISTITPIKKNYEFSAS